jgi:hypothetical protein
MVFLGIFLSGIFYQILREPKFDGKLEHWLTFQGFPLNYQQNGSFVECFKLFCFKMVITDGDSKKKIVLTDVTFLF